MSERSRLQRAIILELLSVEHGEGRTCRQIALELGEEQPAVERAVQELRADGLVVDGADGLLWASRAARRMDELGLLGI